MTEPKYIPQIDSFLMPSGYLMSSQELRYLCDEAARYPFWAESVLDKLVGGSK